MPAFKRASPSATNDLGPRKSGPAEAMMKTENVLYRSNAVPASGTPDVGPCAVCEHELLAHDAIGRRFCQATQANALDRRCMCPGQN